MNWSGLIFGLSLVLALLGAAGAAFAQGARSSVVGLAVAMGGVAGICFALGNDFLALLVLFLLGVGVPAALIGALLLEPVPEPDTRAEGWRGPMVALAIAVGFGVLAWVVTQTVWLPAGGPWQQSLDWLGSRFLTDHLLTLELCVSLLCLSALGTVALLRGRRAGR
jgi:NADH:ubiquinone oxidoreductase subunit 6 (subunit J)